MATWKNCHSVDALLLHRWDTILWEVHENYGYIAPPLLKGVFHFEQSFFVSRIS